MHIDTGRVDLLNYFQYDLICSEPCWYKWDYSQIFSNAIWFIPIACIDLKIYNHCLVHPCIVKCDDVSLCTTIKSKIYTGESVAVIFCYPYSEVLCIFLIIYPILIGNDFIVNEFLFIDFRVGLETPRYRKRCSTFLDHGRLAPDNHHPKHFNAGLKVDDVKLAYLCGKHNFLHMVWLQHYKCSFNMCHVCLRKINTLVLSRSHRGRIN